MNTPDSITVDLSHAKLLKEAGWPQDGYFWFYHVGIGLMEFGDSADMWNHGKAKDATAFEMEESYHAPTAQEILRRLPTGMSSQRGDYLLTCDIGGLRIWNVTYLDEDGRCFFHEDEEVLTEDPSLANAASEMWCYLKKNNLLPQNS